MGSTSRSTKRAPSCRSLSVGRGIPRKPSGCPSCRPSTTRPRGTFLDGERFKIALFFSEDVAEMRRRTRLCCFCCDYPVSQCQGLCLWQGQGARASVFSFVHSRATHSL